MTERSRFFVPYPVAASNRPSGTGREISPLNLANALAADLVQAGYTDAAVVLRPAPRPVVAVFGYFEPSAKARLDALRRQLDRSLSHLRYIDYQRAEADCALLAELLIAQFGREEIRSFRFTAIPRGGLIVLGMLSYILHLERNQVDVSAGNRPDDAPLVVVDDCALTGLRFGDFLQRAPDRPVVFAHLYSHPDLRRAILVRESRVVACLSAHDLHDYAPEELGETYQGWRERLLQRSGDRCYWVGLLDHICFAWNEPDFALWNPVTEQEERGWRVLPPELCLSNRLAPGKQPLPVQIQPDGTGPLRPGRAVLFGTLSDEVILGNIETETSYSLKGVAADIWQAVVEHGNLDDVVAAVVQEYDVEETRLRADVEAFVSELIAAGLLDGSG